MLKIFCFAIASLSLSLAHATEFDRLQRENYEQRQQRYEIENEQCYQGAVAKVNAANAEVARRFAAKHGPVTITANMGRTLEFETRDGYVCRFGAITDGHIQCLSRNGGPEYGEWDSKPVLAQSDCDTYERFHYGAPYKGRRSRR